MASTPSRRVHLGTSSAVRPATLGTATALVVALAGGCDGAALDDLPDLTGVPRTDRARREPVYPVASPADERNSAVVAEREAMLAEGLGDEMDAPAEAHLTLAPYGTPPAAGPNARRLVRFAHLADMQITDDESPTRVSLLDSPGLTSAAYRPQDAYSCALARAMVRSLNAYHREEPLDFVILGGDNADSAQANELDWVLGLLTGRRRLECDSGDDDDPVRGASNDPKDPFVSRGLEMPWYWVTGNHDVLVQGNFPITTTREADVISDEAKLGTRWWSLPGGPVLDGTIPSDRRRELLTPPEMLARVFGDADGHGISPQVRDSGEANYVFDVPGTPLRFLVVDTGAETGGSEGQIRRADLDATIEPALAEADAQGKAVIVVSHHSPISVTDSQLVGTPPADAIPSDEWLTVLGAHPSVLFYLSAHTHHNEVVELPTSRSILQISTSAIVDYPHQSRVLEIWDDDNGFLRVRTTMVDVAVEGDPIAVEGRRLGVLDAISGWGTDGRGTPADRNLEIHIPAP